MTREEAIKWLGQMENGTRIVEYRKALDMAISALQNQPVWIPVTERMPDWRDGKVLVFTKYGFSVCERTVNNRWQGQHANWITHWTPLPEPPEEDAR